MTSYNQPFVLPVSLHGGAGGYNDIMIQKTGQNDWLYCNTLESFKKNGQYNDIMIFSRARTCRVFFTNTGEAKNKIQTVTNTYFMQIIIISLYKQ